MCAISPCVEVTGGVAKAELGFSQVVPGGGFKPQGQEGVCTMGGGVQLGGSEGAVFLSPAIGSLKEPCAETGLAESWCSDRGRVSPECFVF